MSDARAEVPATELGRTPRWFWRAVIGICIVSASIRVVILWEYLSNNPLAYAPTVDAETYWNWAGRIVAGVWREPTPFFSAPLYPYLVAIVRGLSGGMTAVYTCQIVLDAISTGLLGWIALLRFGPVTGVVAAGLYALMIEPASFSVRILTSTVQLFLICVSWLSLLRAQRNPSWSAHAAAGAALGVLTLAHPPAMYVLGLVVAWFAWIQRRARNGVARAALTGVIGAACIAPATLHNHAVSGTAFPVQSALAINLRQGNGPGASGVITYVPGTSGDREKLFTYARETVSRALGRPATWGDVDRYFRDQVIEFWREDWGRTLRLLASKAYWFLTSVNYGDIYAPSLERSTGVTRAFLLTPIPTPLVLSLAFVGLFAMLRRPVHFAPELLFFGVTFAVVVVFWYSPRYRLPAIPVIVVAAAWTVSHVIRTKQERAWSISAFASLALFVGLQVLNGRIGFDSARDVLHLFEMSLGSAEMNLNRPERAIAHFEAALDANPTFHHAAHARAAALRRLGRTAEALESLRALQRRIPDTAELRNTIGSCYYELGRLDEARAEFSLALEINPHLDLALANLGIVNFDMKQYAEAERQFRAALAVSPQLNEGWQRLARAQAAQAKHRDAAESCLKGLRFQADEAALWELLLEQVDALESAGDVRAAVAVLETAIGEYGDNASLLNHFAWLLATGRDDSVRDGARAVKLAGRACSLTNDDPGMLDTLAAAQAEAGQFDAAVRTAERAAAAALAAGAADLAARIESRKAMYIRGRPYREP